MVAVAAVSLLLAVALPHSFFEDWGWLTGPAAWLGCAALTAWALHLDVRGVLLGARPGGHPERDRGRSPASIGWGSRSRSPPSPPGAPGSRAGPDGRLWT